MGRSDIVHGPSFNAIAHVYLKVKTTKKKKKRKIGRYDLMEVAIRGIYYCTSGFRMIASTYFPSPCYSCEMASVKMRPAQSAESMDSLRK